MKTRSMKIGPKMYTLKNYFMPLKLKAEDAAGTHWRKQKRNKTIIPLLTTIPTKVLSMPFPNGWKGLNQTAQNQWRMNLFQKTKLKRGLQKRQ
jgi:hypothetical protein